MRKFPTILLFLALSTGVARAEDLRASLELSSARLAAGDRLVATVTLSNPSSRALLVPRWLVPGARLDADLFAVTRNGEPVTYLGRLVKRAAPGADDFVTLAPGEALRGETDLTLHYDMVAGGEYVVVYRMNLLEGVQADEVRAFGAGVESNAVAAWRDGPAAGPRLARVAAAGGGSLSTPNCSASQASLIGAAVNGAAGYSTDSRSYFDQRTWSTVGARYTTWFGAVDSERFDTVASHFDAIEEAFQSAPIVVNCACTEPYFAYVYPAQPYEIYVCNAFWQAPTTGTDSKAGTLVHEMSHFHVVASTSDHAYGKSACMALASSQPQRAVRNADSHEYFAENSPALEGGGGGSAGTLRFLEAASAVDEDAGSVTLTVRRTGGSNGAVSIQYATANGTASAPGDFTSRSGTLSWAGGDSSNKSFTVTLVDDAVTEEDESFTVTLSSPTGGATLGGPSTSTVTIRDDDCTPSVCVPDANTLCLAGGSGVPNRFRVRVTWTDFEGVSGPGVALPFAADSGFFYFFDPLILELLVKIVNGCGLNDAYWFFYASASNVGLVYTVDDLQTCEKRTVNVPVGQFASNGDVEFFGESCP